MMWWLPLPIVHAQQHRREGLKGYWHKNLPDHLLILWIAWFKAKGADGVLTSTRVWPIVPVPSDDKGELGYEIDQPHEEPGTVRA